MGTRSLIGKQLSDGSILGVYCHYDGYPAYNGRMLRDNFDTVEKVNKLIDGGDMSCTWTNAGWNNETLPESGPLYYTCLLYTSPSPRDQRGSRMPSSA